MASNETSVFYDVAPPTVDRADPAAGEKVASDIFNARKYLDVSFSDVGSGLNLDSIMDADQEFCLEGARGQRRDGRRPARASRKRAAIPLHRETSDRARSRLVSPRAR